MKTIPKVLTEMYCTFCNSKLKYEEKYFKWRCLICMKEYNEEDLSEKDKLKSKRFDQN